MAQVIPVEQTESEWIDLALEAACERWASLPEVEAHFDELDYLEQLPYLEEWALEEQRLEHLRQDYDKGTLNGNQRARYSRLLALARKYRPIIARLQADQQPT